MLISLISALISTTIRLHFLYTNNIAKYEACIIGLKATVDLDIDELEAYRDSTLIIFQATGDWLIGEEKFLNHHECL